MEKIILASSSPRRFELLSEFFNVSTKVNAIDEKAILDKNKDKCINEKIKIIAIEKLNFLKNESQDNIVIACDTVVVFNDKIILKPKDRNDAFNTLKLLSNNKHSVLSVVAIMYKGKIEIIESITDVYFNDNSDELINKYIDTNSPFDKAGGYGIQDMGKLLVKKIDGDFYTVMGLPIAKVYKKIKDILNGEN